MSQTSSWTYLCQSIDLLRQIGGSQDICMGVASRLCAARVLICTFTHLYACHVCVSCVCVMYVCYVCMLCMYVMYVSYMSVYRCECLSEYPPSLPRGRVIVARVHTMWGCIWINGRKSISILPGRQQACRVFLFFFTTTPVTQLSCKQDSRGNVHEHDRSGKKPCTASDTLPRGKQPLQSGFTSVAKNRWTHRITIRLFGVFFFSFLILLFILCGSTLLVFLRGPCREKKNDAVIAFNKTGS